MEPDTGARAELPELKGLNPRQLEAVEHGRGPLLIIAGAGTGKTRTLTCRIAKLIADGVPPSRILAVTFTNKAAAEMRARIEALVPGRGSFVWMHTFHSFGARLLRQHAAAAGLRRDFLIYDDGDQKKIIGDILASLGREDEKNKAGLYINIISRAKDDLIDAGSYAIHAQTSPAPGRALAAEIYTRYEAALNAAGALDFGDLLRKAVELLRNNDAIREYYQEMFQHVLVDEYQDTNHAQYVLTRIMSEKHKNLCVVGDPDQSIYSWRGADIRNILEFERDFPNAKVVALELNYRSTSKILAAADTLIKYNLRRKPKNLYTENPAGEDVSVMELPSETDEARWVAREIMRLVDEDGASLRDIAVFYRTNAQSRSFEDVLRRMQIPHRLIGATRFYDRAEISDALAYARLLVNPQDPVSLSRVVNVPARGISKQTVDKLKIFAAERGVSFYDALAQSVQPADLGLAGTGAAPSYANPLKLTAAALSAIKKFLELLETLHAEAQTASAAFIMQRALLLSGYWKSMEDACEKNPHDKDAQSRMANLQELMNAMKEYEERRQDSGEEPSLPGYLQEVSLITPTDEASGRNGVTLMTVHLAKGLEFPVVFVTGLEEGLFPIGSSDAPDDELEEERRLCYVAMTRARKRLFATHAATRRLFGKMYANLPSRFLFESKLMNQADAVRPGADNMEFVAPPNPKVVPAGRALDGQRVRHAVYGTGRILSQSGSGENVKITVLFDQGGRQTFMLRYAPLEIL
ncbi:MAG: UvrD-helicase domain-containing protein [Elusimicrobiales bacterium]|nr:UvrD-helicase domain-containing protein [Elusimicrobiales bacterium]